MRLDPDEIGRLYHQISRVTGMFTFRAPSPLGVELLRSMLARAAAPYLVEVTQIERGVLASVFTLMGRTLYQRTFLIG